MRWYYVSAVAGRVLDVSGCVSAVVGEGICVSGIVGRTENALVELLGDMRVSLA